MPVKKRGGSGKRKPSPRRKKSPTPDRKGKKAANQKAEQDAAKKKAEEAKADAAGTQASSAEGSQDQIAEVPAEAKSRKTSSAQQGRKASSAQAPSTSEQDVEVPGTSGEGEDSPEQGDENESSKSSMALEGESRVDSGESEEESEEEGDEFGDESILSLFNDEEEGIAESESTVSEVEADGAAGISDEAKPRKKLSAMTEEEKLELMYRRDSELSYPAMIDKDILWFDLLTGAEDENDIMSTAMSLAVSEVDMTATEPEEEEEEEEEEEDEGEEEEEVLESAPEPPPPEPTNDDDNFASLMLGEEEEEGLELLYMDEGAAEADSQSIATFPGVVGINISNATLEWFEISDLAEKKPPHAYISFKRVKLHIYIYQEASEFYPFKDILTHYPDFAILIGMDLTRATGHAHFMCTSLEGRNMVINPPKAKRKVVDARKKEEELWRKLASVLPRKWRTLGSEVEVDLEAKYTERPLITMHAYRYIEAFNRPCEFADTAFDGNKNAYAAFESVDAAKMPLLQIAEMDVGVQVMPQKAVSSTQTGFSFKRNKICQYENQFLDPESVKVILQKPADSLVKKTKGLQRALLQNEMMNLAKDDYKVGLRALKGHDVEYSEQSVILEEYHTYCDMGHSKGRCVTSMTFHPQLEDVVVVSLAEGVTFDKRIDLHSKMLMDPNFVLFWDLKDPTHPQIMLDAPSDVFSFSINPSDPQIVAGGCANGQVVLWDLGREYIDLRARLQDRRRKVKDKGSRGLEFLDKLKATTERKYSCPLIGPVGLSNLDQSHKKVVTSVCWLPAHCEMGKNGSLYENVSGKSVQFFSTAGDSTVRTWDIRPSKLGLDEYEAIPSDIRSNVYLHLENNAWKLSNKFLLDDGSGPIFATILSLSEPRQSDIISFDALTRRDVTKSDSSLNVSSGTSDGKEKSDEAVVSQKPSEVAPKPRDTVLPSTAAALDAVDIEAVTNRRAAGVLNALASVQSSIFIGSIIGQVGLVDWLRNKEGPINPEGGQRVFYNMFIKTIHGGAITSITRSPFYYNLLLVIGGGAVSIWKETSSQPLLAITGSDQFPWCGCWSNTRPAVFFVGTREGSLQVWDLTEKGHAPVLLQQISQDRITNVAIPKAKIGKKQFLALSDSVGNVFVMLLSGYYYKPNRSENAFMLELMSREEKLLQDWTASADERKEKMEAIHNAWKESKVTKTEEELYVQESEIEDRLNKEYKEFVEYDSKMAARLKSDEPALSSESLDVDLKLDELIHAARHRQRANEDEDEDEDEDEVVSEDDSPLGSEYDFLLRTPEGRESIQLSPRKSSRKSQATTEMTDSQQF